MSAVAALPLLEVRPQDFSLDELWLGDRAPGEPLRDATHGGAPTMATSVSLTYDPRALYVHFAGDDQRDFKASFQKRDDPLYEEDVLEIFLTAGDLTRYMEIEVSPLGTLFDARVHSPHGDRREMEVYRDWDCRGLWAASRRAGTGPIIRFDTLVTLPFDGLGLEPPKGGVEWRANFYRIDRRPSGDEYSAWSPTLRRPADFHLPSAFGTIRFL